MEKKPQLTVYNHQSDVVLSDTYLAKLNRLGEVAMSPVLSAAKYQGSALSQLEEVEVSIINDETIADVHVRFMDVEGATDVITFDHGEIHISVETAISQSAEFGNFFEKELALYMIHGLLHLAGHEDTSDDGRAQMNHLQQSILDQLWH